MTIEQFVPAAGLVFTMITALVMVVMWVNKQLRETDKNIVTNRRELDRAIYDNRQEVERAILESRHKVVQDIGNTITIVDERHERETREVEVRLQREINLSKSIEGMRDEIRRIPGPRNPSHRGTD